MELYSKQPDGTVTKVEETTLTNKEVRNLLDAEKASLDAFNQIIAYNQEQKVLCQERINHLKTLI